MQLDPVGVLGVVRAPGAGDHRRGRRRALAQPLHVPGEPRGPAARPLRRAGDDGARGVVQRRPAVDLRGERGQQALRAVGQGPPGQLALGGEARGDRAVLVGGDRGGHGLADREEGGAARHLQERQAFLAGRFHQGPGDVVVVDADGESEAHHSGAHQPLHVPAHRLGVLGVQLEGGDQQQFAALHVGHGVGEFADVGPAHRHVEAVLAGAHGQLERRVVDERGERRGHGCLGLRVCVRGGGRGAAGCGVGVESL